MSITSIIIVLISAFMHALRNLLTKKASNKQAFLLCYEAIGLIYFLPVLIYYSIQNQEISISSIYFILFSGLLHFLYWFFLAKSLENGDLSHVYPISRASPAFVLIASVILLDDKVSLSGGIGIVFATLGVYVINLKKASIKHLAEPILAIRTELSTRYALLTLISVTAYTMVDKLGVMRMNTVMYAGLYPYVSVMIFAAYVLMTQSKEAVITEWRLNKASILICGFLGIFGYLLILIALSYESVSYVAGFRQISVVFAVIMGARVLKEGNKGIRLFAASLICIGTILIAFAK